MLIKPSIRSLLAGLDGKPSNKNWSLKKQEQVSNKLRASKQVVWGKLLNDQEALSGKSILGKNMSQHTLWGVTWIAK